MPSSRGTTSPREQSIDIEKELDSSRVSSSHLDIKSTHEAISNETEKESIAPPTGEATTQWISGFKLWTVMFSISIASFLMLLDTAIIITVRLS